MLITGVLISSATEAGVSSAHRDATQDLYATEAAIQAHVQGSALQLVAGTRVVGSAPGTRITVQQLSDQPVPGFPGLRDRTFSIAGEPVAGGRRLQTLMRTRASAFDLESAATFGGNSELKGSGEINDGRNSQSCDASEKGDWAVVNGAGTTMTKNNNYTVTGGVTESTLTGEALVTQSLGGNSIQSLIPKAEVKFGNHPSWNPTSQGSFVSTNKANTMESWNSNGQVFRDQGHKYNWGCPGNMETATNCANRGADTLRYRIIAIDAGGSANKIKLNGDHGQGLLLVFNGGLEIAGGFVFRGIIAVEGDIDIGAGGNKIEGAILSQNTISVGDPSTMQGSAIITYNRCAIRAIVNLLNDGNSNAVANRTFAWTETVR
ncbi:MAG: hypothetical protein H0X65_17490 [Gemmatimonadetes bacterium]|nr:hypothetical protein [Gemmatimonadota bacterium]